MRASQYRAFKRNSPSEFRRSRRAPAKELFVPCAAYADLGRAGGAAFARQSTKVTAAPIPPTDAMNERRLIVMGGIIDPANMEGHLSRVKTCIYRGDAKISVR